MSYLKSIFLVFLLFAVPTLANKETPTATIKTFTILPDKFGENWRAINSAKNLSAGWVATDQQAKVYAEYGVQSVTTRQYVNGKEKISLEAFETKYASGAYGLLTYERNQGNSGVFQNGRYLLRVTPWNDALAQTLNPELIFKGVEDNELSEIPQLPTYLPEQGKIVSSEKYIIGPAAISQIQPFTDFKDLLDFTGGTNAAIADYENGGGKMSLILIEYQTPQFATDGFAKIQQHFNALPPDEKNRRILKRVGNYVVEAVNVAEQKSAEELIGKIKYSVIVYWEGKKVSDLPMDRRPPDPYVVNEVIQTGRFIVATFYWIGILGGVTIFSGVFAGGAFFYWRRFQRRKLGLDQGFSDAGGMTVLNLDEYLLSASERKMLGKGK